MSKEDWERFEKQLAEEWVKKGVFNSDPNINIPKKFITFPFPYMNGSLHLGHAYSAGRLDVLARYYRLKGYNVLYPWAWHWTGEAVMGVVHRLEAGDQRIINRLINLDGVEPEEIERFKDPIYLVKYFTNKGKQDVIHLGLSIDWRREFHTTNLHPLYTKSVEWQIRRLNKRGFIVQEPHPVVWCPRDKSPTGDHDRLEGVGVRPEEYNLIKFYIDDLDAYIVAGTFRPETLFGVTNIWIREDADYALINIDGERWIVSLRAVDKLRDQLHNVEVIEVIKGESLIGLYAKAPYINRLVPILPASFVDPGLVTGVVYSVPAHAPYDYAALIDLKKGMFNLRSDLKNIVDDIQPISIISVPGYGEFPAKDAYDKYGVSNQLDIGKLEDATKDIYSIEFHKGVMKDNCMELSGLRVSEAKNRILDILRSIGMATTMYDLPEKVVCRCGTETHVKIIEDQWALKYSDERWKSLARDAVNSMDFFPEELRKMFLHYIDWYEDWPCTRKTGLGTPFPLDKDWIVETLTDSTVYMAFYIIAKYYNAGKLDAEKIDDSFFDYIFLGEGDPDKLSNDLGIPRSLIDEIRNEFLYWYPVDIRGSGKDLIGNHLTFFIFHHVAIFEKRHWPRGISVNGYIKLEGKPMSKSTGNFISLRKAIEMFGSDTVRLGLLTITDGLDDPDVRLDNFRSIREKLRSLPDFIKDILDKSRDYGEESFFDRLIAAKLAMYISEVESSLESHKIAVAGRIVFYKIPEALAEYSRVSDRVNRRVLERLLEAWVKILSLYAPFTSEFIWREVLGKQGMAALSKWPSLKFSEQDKIYIDLEEYGRELLSDIDGIMRIVDRGGEEASTIKIIIPSNQKWSLMRDIITSDKELISIRDFLSISNNLGLDKKQASTIYKIIRRHFYGRYYKFRELLARLSWNMEKEFLEKYFSKYVKIKYPRITIEVLLENDVSGKYRDKAVRSLPLMPAIIIE